MSFTTSIQTISKAENSTVADTPVTVIYKSSYGVPFKLTMKL